MTIPYVIKWIYAFGFVIVNRLESLSLSLFGKKLKNEHATKTLKFARIARESERKRNAKYFSQILKTNNEVESFCGYLSFSFFISAPLYIYVYI